MRKTFTLAVLLLVLVGCRREEKPKQPPTPLPPPKASATEPRAAVSSTASYADAVDRASPGVVSIRAEQRGRAPQQHPFFNDPMLRDFFGLFGGNQPGGPRVQAALGSGVIVQPDGVILTNHGLQEARGVVVAAVAANSPTARAGIRPGDAIVGFNGEPVTDGNTLRNRVASTPPNTQINLAVLRDRREQQMQVTLGEYQRREGS
jgi:S1-C subfamily serine protease